MSMAQYARQNTVQVGGVVALIAIGVLGTLLLDLPVEALLTVGFVERSFQAAAPIALAAVGGLYAEKSGVFNVGLEGFMIFGAVNAAAIMWIVGGSSPGQSDLWIAVFASGLLTLVYVIPFAVLVIRYKANQLVAGLAVWFIGLGFGPFTAVLVWGSRNSPGLTTINDLTIPFLAEIPVLGPVLFDSSPLVLFALLVTVVAWIVLFRTRYGYWLQAAGENPEALDTAGISVTRVRYAATIFSGVMAGLGGAVLLAQAGSFTGTGETMVAGRGWIAIVAYLFGNYNPIGAAAAALLFGGLDMLQIQFQTAGISVPNKLVNLFPYVIVIVVLTIWGSTRVPSAVGESYESEE
ncbi:ABC transporter permease [Halococcus salifodinae]|uniref:Inner-membrane translocator n=1 Tax=Halococcus salifodinae DSM 8989 TaxID=1227456 RepID=M0NFM2_9EURY|nr:ABC transporter permease [Halococcus salifodinae]EMA55894.1 inner-membrane translocator [Halococcus salifodinae DSM 8989]